MPILPFLILSDSLSSNYALIHLYHSSIAWQPPHFVHDTSFQDIFWVRSLCRSLLVFYAGFSHTFLFFSFFSLLFPERYVSYEFLRLATQSVFLFFLAGLAHTLRFQLPSREYHSDLVTALVSPIDV